MLLTGTWRFGSSQELLRVVDLLSRTKGIVSIQILPGRIVFQSQPWVKSVDLLPQPEEPITWEDKLSTIELLPYSTRTLFEGVVFGWIELRKRHRYPTHICVWDHESFYDELFPGSEWPHEQDYFHSIYGMEVVPMKEEAEFTKGTVILCGGKVQGGGVAEVDLGLVLRRGKE